MRKQLFYKNQIQGNCERKFSMVREIFSYNFKTGNEVGASLAAAINGKFVVDLWGGYADEARTKLWEKDTIVCVYSLTKIMTSICAFILIDRGQLDPDAPVTKYWPEFAQGGKEGVLVRHILSHTAGLYAVDAMPLPIETLLNCDTLNELLAKQQPLSEPGKIWQYHAITFGNLVGEIVQRITGMSLGNFFRHEVTEPLAADFDIGIPKTEMPRVAEMVPPAEQKPGDVGYIPPESVFGRAMNFPFSTPQVANNPFFCAVEAPANNGHGNARSLARIGSVIACGGQLDGVKLMRLSTIKKAFEVQYHGTPEGWLMPIKYGLGFALKAEKFPLGPNQHVFWWGGWGGSFMLIDLDARLSFAYAMNKMSTGVDDTRATTLLAAFYDSL